MVLLVISCCRMFYSIRYNLTVLLDVVGVNVNAFVRDLFPAASPSSFFFPALLDSLIPFFYRCYLASLRKQKHTGD